MIAFLVSVLLLGQNAEVNRPVSERYETIINSLKEKLSDTKNTREELGLATRTANEQLAMLLDDAMSGRLGSLRPSDYEVLAKACERLRRTEQAVELARLGVDGRAVEPYITLIRCLCAARRMAEAEKVVREVDERFPVSERRYLAHNIIAIKYSGLGEYEKSFDYFVVAAKLVAKQVGSKPFFATYLAHCMECADRSAIKANSSRRATDLRNELIAQLLERADGEQRMRGGLSGLQRARQMSQACISICGTDERERAGLAFNIWLRAFSSIGDVNDSDAQHWLQEAQLLLGELPVMLLKSEQPDFELEIESELLPAVIDRANKLRETCDLAVTVCRLAKEVKQQIESCRSIRMNNGDVVLSAEEFQKMAGDSRCKYVLISVINPLDNTIRQSATTIAEVKPNLESHSIKVALCAEQCGATWAPALGRLVIDRKTTLRQEIESLQKYRRHHDVAINMTILPPAFLSKSNPKCEVYPRNLLIAKDGRIVEQTLGNHPYAFKKLVHAADGHKD